MKHISITKIREIQKVDKIFEQNVFAKANNYQLFEYTYELLKVRKTLHEMITNIQTCQTYKEMIGMSTLNKIVQQDINLIIFYYKSAYSKLQSQPLEPTLKIALGSHCLFQIQSLEQL